MEAQRNMDAQGTLLIIDSIKLIERIVSTEARDGSHPSSLLEADAVLGDG